MPPLEIEFSKSQLTYLSNFLENEIKFNLAIHDMSDDELALINFENESYSELLKIVNYMIEVW